MFRSVPKIIQRIFGVVIIILLLKNYCSVPLKYLRRRRDLNPRAAINDLLPFQGSPFSHLGTSPNAELSGEDGIRTHVPLRTNGFQDRLVMTTSIPLHVFNLVSQKTSRFLRATLTILSKVLFCVNRFFNKIINYFFDKKHSIHFQSSRR